MPDTKRQAIVTEIKRRLAAISTANGYETELGAGPIDEWPIAYQDEELPALGVFDLVNNVVQEYAQQKAIMNQLPCQVRIFLPREPNPATVRKMLADVMRAAISDPDSGERDATLGGLVVDMQPEEDGFIVPKESFQIDGAAVGFMVQFLSAPFNAYQ
jgi:hypothetical protein